MLKHPKKIPNRQQFDSIPDMSICQIINDKYRCSDRMSGALNSFEFF